MKKWLLLLPLLLFFSHSQAESRVAALNCTLILPNDTLIIKMADAGIVEPVTGLSVTLQDETSGENQILSYDPTTMVARAPVNTDHRYTIAIDAPGYTPYRKYIAQVQPGQEITVSLQRKNVENEKKKHLLIVMDREQRSVVPNAEVLVFGEDKSPVEVELNKGRFVVLLPKVGDFTYQVMAKEYEPTNGRILRSETGIIEVGLLRRKGPPQTQTIAFVAQDAFTKKPIGARFWLKGTETSPTATVTTAANPQYGTELKLQQPYTLQVESDGYEVYKQQVKVDTPESEPIEPRLVLMEPLTYPVIFTLVDAVTMKNIDPVSFEIRSDNKILQLQNITMARQAVLTPGKKYEVRVTKPGYGLFERTMIFGKPTGRNDLIKSILLSPNKPSAEPTSAPVQTPATIKTTPKADDAVFENLEVGEAVRLDNVYFDQSSYILRPESHPQLDKLIKTLKLNSKLKIEIAGHTDNVGDARLNQFLSENRAKVISSFLVNHGIPDTRLVWKGYGQTKPIAANDSEENKAQNRRVEFVVLEN
ncbi:OmpA family protein [Persicitalea sp.]|uniref:OmpA family protein n=1 Tax=Persicitalea sp. TaxID=3100273 RepID=UPI003593B530